MELLRVMVSPPRRSEFNMDRMVEFRRKVWHSPAGAKVSSVSNPPSVEFLTWSDEF